MSDRFRIVYEEDGFPRELVDSREWARAVRDGSLGADTRVTVHRAGERAVVVAAGDVPELRDLLSPPIDDMPGLNHEPEQVQSPPEGVARGAQPIPPTTPVRPAPDDAAAPTPPRFGQGEVWDQPDGGLGAARRASGAPRHGGRVQRQDKLAPAIIAGVVLLLLVIVGLSNGRTGEEVAAENVAAPTDTLVNDSAPADAGQAITEGTAYEWTDNGSPQTFTTERLQLVLGSEDNGEGGKLPVLTVRSTDLGDSKIVGVQGGETASAKFMVLRPTRTDRFPSVLLMTYSMGAHCCTSYKLLTPKGAAWTLADLGEWDGEALDSAPADVDGDGRLDFVMRDNAFLYAFASYADSWTPSLVYNVVDGRFVDRSTSSRYRSVHAADMERTRTECAKHNNGACAAFVASAARLGEQAAALQFASANFDQAATQGWLPNRCQTQVVDGSCPAGSELQPGGFIEALDWFLQDHGYVRGSIQAPFEIPTPAETGSASDPPTEPDGSADNVGDTDGD